MTSYGAPLCKELKNIPDKNLEKEYWQRKLPPSFRFYLEMLARDLMLSQPSDTIQHAACFFQELVLQRDTELSLLPPVSYLDRLKGKRGLPGGQRSPGPRSPVPPPNVVHCKPCCLAESTSEPVCPPQPMKLICTPEPVPIQQVAPIPSSSGRLMSPAGFCPKCPSTIPPMQGVQPPYNPAPMPPPLPTQVTATVIFNPGAPAPIVSQSVTPCAPCSPPPQQAAPPPPAPPQQQASLFNCRDGQHRAPCKFAPSGPISSPMTPVAAATSAVVSEQPSGTGRCARCGKMMGGKCGSGGSGSVVALKAGEPCEKCGRNVSQDPNTGQLEHVYPQNMYESRDDEVKIIALKTQRNAFGRMVKNIPIDKNDEPMAIRSLAVLLDY